MLKIVTLTDKTKAQKTNHTFSKVMSNICKVQSLNTNGASSLFLSCTFEQTCYLQLESYVLLPLCSHVRMLQLRTLQISRKPRQTLGLQVNASFGSSNSQSQAWLERPFKYRTLLWILPFQISATLFQTILFCSECSNHMTI